MHRTRASGLAFLLAAGALAGCSDPKDRPGQLSSTETALISYRSCEALETDLREMILEEVEAHFDQERYWQTHPNPWLEDGAAGPPVADANASDSPGRTEGEDYSGTNNQEVGVDEADFVKTDGYHIYLINGNRLHIHGVPEFGQLTPESVLELEGWPTEMLVDGDSGRVAVFSSVDVTTLPAEHPLRARVAEPDGRGGFFYRVSGIAKVTVVDASDRRAPKIERELYLEGWYQTARLVDGMVRLGAYSWMHIPEVDHWKYYWYSGANLSIDQREEAAKRAARQVKLEDVVPRIYERRDGGLAVINLTSDDCTTFHRPTDSHGRGVTSLLAFDLGDAASRIGNQQIVTNHSVFYASADSIYLAEPAHDWWWFWWNSDVDATTNIHRFDRDMRYLGSGRVAGTVLNQFSLSEKDDVLRVATTTNRLNRWWIDPQERPQSESHVFTLKLDQGELVHVGHLGGLAPGEAIWSARFVGDRAFLVTFRNIDPLFAVDVSDPENPILDDELKVLGVSTYIHPLDDGRLLTIGYGGTDDGLDWRAQVSLFDATDPTDLALLDVEPLAGDRSYAWSEALYQHKAFQYWAPRKLLAVPVSSYQTTTDGANGWTWSYTSVLQLVSVGDGGLSTYGVIDHSGYYNSDRSHLWVLTDVRRSIFMGDFIYAISDRAISVHRIADLGLVTDVELPGYVPNQWYWAL